MNDRPAVLLDYAAGEQVPPPQKAWLHWGMLGVWLIAVATCFVSFTSMAQVTPWAVSQEIATLIDSVNWTDGENVLVLMGVSFLTAIGAAIWKLRRGIGQPTKWERRGALAFAVISLGPVTVLLGLLIYGIHRDMDRDLESAMWIGIVLVSLGSLLVSALLALSLKRRGQPAAAIDVLMMSPFIANGIICLMAFVSEREIGWWLTLIVEVLWFTYCGAMILPMVRRWHANRRLARDSSLAST